MKSKKPWPLNKELRRAFGCLFLAFFVFFDKHGDFGGQVQPLKILWKEADGFRR